LALGHFTARWRHEVIQIGECGMECGMGPFGRWLARRFGYAESGSWALTLLEQCGGNEQQTIHQLWPLYEEYLMVRRGG
jgi:hypothetical protein